MDNENTQKLDALTNQPVTLKLGAKVYRARRATLRDVGFMNRKRKEMSDSGDTANMDMDLVFCLLYELIKGYHPEVTSPEQLAESILFEDYPDVTKAMEIVGFKQPQAQPKTEETGA